MTVGTQTISDVLARKREAILALARRHGARNVRVFGSVARGQADDASDLDLLVAMDPDRSLFDVGGLVMDLQELLGIKVDVITEGSLYGRFGELVTKEAVPL